MAHGAWGEEGDNETNNDMIMLNKDKWVRAYDIKWMEVEIERIWPEERAMWVKYGGTREPHHILWVKTDHGFQSGIFHGTQEECRNEAARIQTDINKELRP